MVRVKGGMSLRDDIIMLKTNKLTEERILFSRQFSATDSFFDVVDSRLSQI